MTERVALQAQPERRAFHDALTGLPNRALFTDRVAHALRKRTVGTTPPAVLFLDLDGFQDRSLRPLGQPTCAPAHQGRSGYSVPAPGVSQRPWSTWRPLALFRALWPLRRSPAPIRGPGPTRVSLGLRRPCRHPQREGPCWALCLRPPAIPRSKSAERTLRPSDP
ncbi:diguanylate cyclase domain-containing protein [Streptomyces mirabilis]|uniref:diguanylate cyclase domain-containing protein n=1 Tax=Streptomyces mirabilis TaxID=68239 RepID=UPI0036B0B4CD